MEPRTPVEILAFTSDTGLVKTQRKTHVLLILAFFAGAYIAITAGCSNIAGYFFLAKPETYGLGKVLLGSAFSGALILIIIAGGELFTGNMLIVVSVMERRVAIPKMLRNWGLVYLGNFLGSLCVVFMTYHSGLFNTSTGLLGGVTIKIAAGKLSLPFHSAFILGIMCNWLVCLAVWLTYGVRDAAGKCIVIFFLMYMFVLSGFEHCVANMYYIPAGIMAARNPQWVAMSNLSMGEVAGLNWTNFITRNLFPVTLGNILGGSCMVGILYWIALRKKTP
jgi:formate/nitrite transporter